MVKLPRDRTTKAAAGPEQSDAQEVPRALSSQASNHAFPCTVKCPPPTHSAQVTMTLQGQRLCCAACLGLCQSVAWMSPDLGAPSLPLQSPVSGNEEAERICWTVRGGQGETLLMFGLRATSQAPSPPASCSEKVLKWD